MKSSAKKRKPYKQSTQQSNNQWWVYFLCIHINRWGACGVMVIIIGNGRSNPSSSLLTRLIIFSHSANTFGKGMNPLAQKEENLFNSAKKLTLCHILLMAEELGKYISINSGYNHKLWNSCFTSYLCYICTSPPSLLWCQFDNKYFYNV